MFSEKEIRRVIREELRNIIVRHNLKQLNEKVESPSIVETRDNVKPTVQPKTSSLKGHKNTSKKRGG